MKAQRFFAILLMGVSIFPSLGAAEKEKKGVQVDDYPFWTVEKRGYAPQFFPGLNAALQLTDAQKQQIAAARDEMANDEGVKATRGLSKNDPNVTDEQREKARAAVAAAAARMRERVATILTPEQKTLIEKINAAWAAAGEATGIIYSEKFASVKGDEAARRRVQEEKAQDLEDQFLHKLDGILTPAQREAMTRAGEEEHQRNLKAAAMKKPVK